MKNMKLSIIVPIYNMEKYLDKCINSILNQKYKNFELILVDDGSIDSSGSICDKYKEKDKRVKVIHKKNGGVSSARNKGLSIATGEYIGFIDPDDFIDKNMYSILIKNIEKNNSDISICGNKDILENGKVFCQTYPGELIQITPDECLKGILNETKYIGTCWNKIYRKELFDNIKFKEGMSIAEDLDLLINIIPKCNNIVYDSTPLYFWVIHPSSTVHSNFTKNKMKWDQEINLCNNIIKKYSKSGNDILNYAIKRYVRVNIFCISRILKENSKDISIKEYRKNIMKYYRECMCFDFVKKTFKLKIFLIKINPKLIKLYDYMYFLIKGGTL